MVALTKPGYQAPAQDKEAAAKRTKSAVEFIKFPFVVLYKFFFAVDDNWGQRRIRMHGKTIKPKYTVE